MPSGDRTRRALLDRLARGLGWGALLLLVALTLLLAGRVALHRQRDDPERLAEKRRYLESIGRLAAERPAGPNLVVVLFDDLGYGDLGSYGGRSIRTPWLDRVAGEGARFTDAYSASPYCSAARAALLTGRHAVRAGLDHVVQAPWTSRDLLLRVGWRNRRLPAEEITLAEVLGAAGYATGLFGKWHLGDEPPSLPGDLGFDEFFGLLHSNDQGKPRLWDGRSVLEEHPIDQRTLTRRYTERAVDFLERNQERPFFLYLPHTFPHIPLHVAAERRGGSPGGLYGDVVEELDESVGALVSALDRLGLAEETLLVVSSDNGPWFQGSPGRIRGRKLDIFEGGMRVPLLVRRPGSIAPDRVVSEPVMGIDLFPTMLELAGLPPPDDRVIDGVSLVPLLAGTGSPARDLLPYFQLGVLRAVRSGRFKYHARHRVAYGNPMDWPWGYFKPRGPWLFDLALDPDESYDVSDRHPEIASRLARRLAEERRRVEENPGGWLR